MGALARPPLLASIPNASDAGSGNAENNVLESRYDRQHAFAAGVTETSESMLDPRMDRMAGGTVVCLTPYSAPVP